MTNLRTETGVAGSKTKAVCRVYRQTDAAPGLERPLGCADYGSRGLFSSVENAVGLGVDRPRGY